MRILFMGTPQFAAVSLRALLKDGWDLIGVVTQPDKPKGRGLRLQASEVKSVTVEAGLRLWQPAKVLDPEFISVFQQLKPELVVVVAFGQKIPETILFGPKFGCINLHGSLLPQYRGAAPVQWSILNGDRTTGITTMYMDQGWDTGDMIYQQKVTIGPDENFSELYERLANLGAGLLVKTVRDIAAQKAPRIPQDDNLATLAPKPPIGWRQLDWSLSAEVIHNRVRAFAPIPGCETNFNDERLKIIRTQRIDYDVKGDEFGKIFGIIKNQGIVINAGGEPLLITQVQPAGKKIMTAFDYANGKRIQTGMFFKQNVNII